MFDIHYLVTNRLFYYRFCSFYNRSFRLNYLIPTIKIIVKCSPLLLNCDVVTENGFKSGCIAFFQSVNICFTVLSLKAANH